MFETAVRSGAADSVMVLTRQRAGLSGPRSPRPPGPTSSGGDWVEARRLENSRATLPRGGLGCLLPHRRIGA